LREFLNGAELFVYPSLAEGFGIPPLEAGVLKTPVLCSSKTAMGDFQFFGDDLFDPEDTIEFQAKLKKKLEYKTNEGKLDYICDTIQSVYSWGESANKINKIFKII
jgi:glycosyltransferase involved in cell wall biosynthesis